MLSLNSAILLNFPFGFAALAIKMDASFALNSFLPMISKWDVTSKVSLGLKFRQRKTPFSYVH